MTEIIDLLFDDEQYADAYHAFGEDLGLFLWHMYNICVSAIS